MCSLQGGWLIFFFFFEDERIAGSLLSQQTQQASSSPRSPSCSTPWESRLISLSLSSDATSQPCRRHPHLLRLCSCNATALSICKFLLKFVQKFLNKCRWAGLWQINAWKPLFHNSLPRQYNFSGNYDLLFIKKIVQKSCRTSTLKGKCWKSFSKREVVRAAGPTLQQSCQCKQARQFSTSRMRSTGKQELIIYKKHM